MYLVKKCFRIFRGGGGVWPPPPKYATGPKLKTSVISLSYFDNSLPQLLLLLIIHCPRSTISVSLTPSITPSNFLYAGAWCAGSNDGYQFLQVDFRRLKKITKVATQGRPGGTSYVTKYMLRHSLDGKTWIGHDQVILIDYE